MCGIVVVPTLALNLFVEDTETIENLSPYFPLGKKFVVTPELAGQVKCSPTNLTESVFAFPNTS